MLFTTDKTKQFFFLASLLFAVQVMAETETEASPLHHKYPPGQALSDGLTESGTDMFATIQEVIKNYQLIPTPTGQK